MPQKQSTHSGHLYYLYLHSCSRDVCVSHLAGLQHIDLLFIHSVLILLQEAFTLVLDLLNKKAAQLVLQLGSLYTGVFFSLQSERLVCLLFFCSCFRAANLTLFPNQWVGVLLKGAQKCRVLIVLA